MNSPANFPDSQNDDTIDLMDILLTLAENLKLLVIGPLVAGALALGLTYLLPQTFESTAILKAEPSTATYMTSATVLDAALRNLGYLKDLDEDQAEEARIQLQRQVTTQSGRNDKLVTLRVEARSPAAAQRMAGEILIHTFAGSKPREAELKRLAAQRDILSQQSTELAAASKTAQQILDRALPTDNLGSVAESIAAISSNLIRIQEGIHDVEKRMQGLSEDDLIQAPTLPRRPIAPKKALTAVLTTLVAGFALLAFVLIRQSWRSSRSAQVHQLRIDALKRRYGIDR